jgi:hypothetical protein
MCRYSAALAPPHLAFGKLENVGVQPTDTPDGHLRRAGQLTVPGSSGLDRGHVPQVGPYAVRAFQPRDVPMPAPSSPRVKQVRLVRLQDPCPAGPPSGAPLYTTRLHRDTTCECQRSPWLVGARHSAAEFPTSRSVFAVREPASDQDWQPALTALQEQQRWASLGRIAHHSRAVHMLVSGAKLTETTPGARPLSGNSTWIPVADAGWCYGRSCAGADSDETPRPLQRGVVRSLQHNSRKGLKWHSMR